MKEKIEENISDSSEMAKSEKSRFPKTRAKIILCRCAEKDGFENLFGIRIEEKSKVWFRTWAFKISEEKAKHEGWDSEKITSSLNALPEYNGCPYCGSFSFAQCSCGKLFCFGKKNFSNAKQIEMKCPWCKQIGVYQTVEAVEVQGGGF